MSNRLKLSNQIIIKNFTNVVSFFKDTYLMGEFEVVKELLEKMPAFREPQNSNGRKIK